MTVGFKPRATGFRYAASANGTTITALPILKPFCGILILAVTNWLGCKATIPKSFEATFDAEFSWQISVSFFFYFLPPGTSFWSQSTSLCLSFHSSRDQSSYLIERVKKSHLVVVLSAPLTSDRMSSGLKTTWEPIGYRWQPISSLSPWANFISIWLRWH